MDEITKAINALIHAFKMHGLEAPTAIVVGDPGDRVRLQMLVRLNTAKFLRHKVRGEVTAIMGVQILTARMSDVSDGRKPSDVPAPFTGPVS
jgi:hypothetical protein